MAESTVNINLDTLTGRFDINSVLTYNLINLGRHVLNNFTSTYNFCCEIGLIKSERTCPRCRRKLKLSIDRRPDHKTPVTYCCTNSKCSKQYFSIRESSLFDNSNLALDEKFSFWPISSYPT